MLCRDAAGLYLGASVVVFDGLTDPETWESIACSEALSLTFDLNIQKIQIATDCLQVVRNFKEQVMFQEVSPSVMSIGHAMLKPTIM